MSSWSGERLAVHVMRKGGGVMDGKKVFVQDLGGDHRVIVDGTMAQAELEVIGNHMYLKMWNEGKSHILLLKRGWVVTINPGPTVP